MFVRGYCLKVFDAYRPACAVRSFVLWGIEDQDKRMKEYFYPSMEKDELLSTGISPKDQVIAAAAPLILLFLI